MVTTFSFALFFPELFLFFLSLFLVFGVLYLKVEKKISSRDKTPLLNASMFSLLALGFFITFLLVLETPETFSLFLGTINNFFFLKVIKCLVLFIAFLLVIIFKQTSKVEKLQNFEVAVLLSLSLVLYFY